MSKKEQIAFLSLVEKYLNGKASVEEQELLDAYYDLFDDSPNALERIPANDLQPLEARMKGRIARNIARQEKAPGKLTTYKYLAVAAAVTAIALFVYFFGVLKQVQNDGVVNEVVVNDVAPGKNGATLTLANGQKILINDASAGKIASQNGVTITKTASGLIIYEIASSPRNDGNIDQSTYNSLSTTRGQQAQVRLPDGSLVFLNAASTLKYPTSFAGAKERSVSLTGEAYFEITHNKFKPFKVSAGGQTVEVLGTHFNINSYADEPDVTTTLLEGSVRIIPASLRAGAAKQSPVILKPNQQAVLTANNNLSVQDVDAANAVAWKNGEFVFERENIKSIMRKISRWYNVDIQYEGDVEKKALWGSISKYANVKDLLEMLSGTGAVRFELKDKTIIVRPAKK